MSDVTARLANFNMLKRQLEMIKKHTPDTPISQTDAVILLERVKKIMDKLEAAHDKIVLTCTSEADIDLQLDTITPMEKVYQEARARLHDILEEYNKSSSAATVKQKVKLPTMDLPKFDGNYFHWTSFKNLFEANIDSEKGLTDGQKLQYLMGSVIGDAKKVISTLQITNANYKEAWDLLNARYNNNREIVSSVLDRLCGPKEMTTESPHDLQNLLDTVRECIRTLKVLKRPVDKWDDVLLHFYTKMIDQESRKQWALRLKGTDIPTFEEFATFLEDHIRGLLASGAGSQKSSTSGGRAGGKQISSHHTSTEPTCPVCKQNHPIYKCSEFVSKSTHERNATVKRLHLCFNCLKSDHKSVDCKNQRTCKKCSRRHHTMLHSDNAPAAAAASIQSHTAHIGGNLATKPQQGGTSSSSPDGIDIHHSKNEDENQVLLATALALAGTSGDSKAVIRILLDGGSQGTFISEDCVRRLNLKRKYSRISISGIAGVTAGTTNGIVYLNIQSRFNNKCIPIIAHVLPTVTKTLPVYPFNTGKWSHLKGIKLADPHYNRPSPIDLLLDAAYVLQLETGGIIKSSTYNAPGAKETILGWVVTGHMPTQPSSLTSFNVETSTNLDSLLQKFWEFESIPQIKHLSPEEQACEEYFKSTHQRDANGKFIVRLPFNEKKQQLGQSRAMAIQRLLSVERRLQRQPHHKEAYNKFMEEYERLGHMEIVPTKEVGEVLGKTNYLPHHFVVNNSSTTTKLRVVFDGSARTSTDVSLNDTMMVGPTLQDDLYNILLRFRLNKVVIKADMVKMFRQFMVNPSDADMQRIFWRYNTNQPIKEYRLRTVTYGTASAPYLSTKCLQQLAKDCSTSQPIGSTVLKQSTYVDDVMHSTTSTAEGKEIYRQLTSIANSAGISLGKWATNDHHLLEFIPQDQRETELSLGIERSCNIKALGVQWNPATDTFKFKVSPIQHSKNLTKRILLSELAKVYDPLGLITPLTIRAKILMQDLWKLNLNWDDELPTIVKDQWKDYCQDIQLISQLTIPRWISEEEVNFQELHCFSDSSERALGMVIYLKTVTSTGSIKVQMVTSKSKVAPIKQISIPKLELCAAMELAELIDHVKSALKLDCKIYCWSDSTITLHWIAGLPYKWKTYVANKVAKIQRVTEASWWRHVPGSQNPADLVSRGISSSQLINNSFWWHGPEFLHQLEVPSFSPPPVEESDDLQERKKSITCHLSMQVPVFSKKYSSLFTTQRVMAYVLRFIKNAKKSQQHKEVGALTSGEMKNAFNYLIREAQREMFPGDLNALQAGTSLHPKSKLLQLNPFINHEGIICVGGRLQRANLPERSKHQSILQHDHHLTQLIIRQHHLSHLHGGFQVTWAALQRQFWILRGRDSVRHLVRKCVTCRRHRAKNMDQLMGNLPSPRVNITRPFLQTGVDFCGPFHLRTFKERKPLIYKAYIAVFVCMATKAVHLEAVSDLTAETFIATIRRFVGRRGICTSLFSDDGTNFQGADTELRRLMKNEDYNSKIQDYCATQGMQWNFIPPSSPHHGGLWEAAVKSAKFHLKRVIGNAHLTFEQFQTILCQVEAVLNSRPLMPMSTDPTDLDVLTPGHFVIGEALTAVPDDNLCDLNPNRLSKWQQQQQRIQHFWKRWSREYLVSLQQRQKWLRPKENIRVGDLVLLKEDNLPPAKWKLGRVIATHTGADGFIRVATVKTATSEFQRSIVKLTPILSNEAD